MNRLSKGISIVVAGLALGAFAPGLAQAAPLSCVTQLIENIHAGDDANGQPCSAAPMKLVMISKNGSWVSYSEGAFAMNTVGHPQTTTNIKQQFSNRKVGDTDQNFNINSVQKQGVEINPVTHVMTVKNFSTNVTKQVTVDCDGDAIVGSDSTHVYIVTHFAGTCPL